MKKEIKSAPFSESDLPLLCALQSGLNLHHSLLMALKRRASDGGEAATSPTNLPHLTAQQTRSFFQQQGDQGVALQRFQCSLCTKMCREGSPTSTSALRKHLKRKHFEEVIRRHPLPVRVPCQPPFLSPSPWPLSLIYFWYNLQIY